MKYKMNHSGGTTGAKSGQEYSYKKGDVVEEAESGDLDHLDLKEKVVEKAKKTKK